QTPPRIREAPVVAAIHGHEGRYVKCLREIPRPEPPVLGGGGERKNVGLTLVPRRIGDFGNDAIERFAAGRVAIIKADRIEYITGVAQMSQQAHGPLGPL